MKRRPAWLWMTEADRRSERRGAAVAWILMLVAAVIWCLQ